MSNSLLPCQLGRLLHQNRLSMRTSLIRTAQAVNINGTPRAALESLQVARSKLLPPVPLYRNLLRTHRQLPLEMRSLGDDYVKAEFKRHKQADNPVHIMGFLLEWNQYLDQLHFQFEQSSPDSFRGKRMDDTLFEKMSNEQLGQLYELMHASKDVWKPAESNEQDSDPESTKS